MIIIGNLNQMDTQITTYDGEKISIDSFFAIVRNNKKQWICNLDALSPSSKLYNYYLKEKKAFRWTAKNFEENFVPQYINEIKNNPQAMEIISKLIAADKNIFLGCFCENECLCHRSILGGILLGLGCEVKSVDNDCKKFLKYYDMFANIESEVN